MRPRPTSAPLGRDLSDPQATPLPAGKASLRTPAWAAANTSVPPRSARPCVCVCGGAERTWLTVPGSHRARRAGGHPSPERSGPPPRSQHPPSPRDAPQEQRSQTQPGTLPRARGGRLSPPPPPGSRGSGTRGAAGLRSSVPRDGAARAAPSPSLLRSNPPRRPDGTAACPRPLGGGVRRTVCSSPADTPARRDEAPGRSQ